MEKVKRAIASSLAIILVVLGLSVTPPTEVKAAVKEIEINSIDEFYTYHYETVYSPKNEIIMKYSKDFYYGQLARKMYEEDEHNTGDDLWRIPYDKEIWEKYRDPNAISFYDENYIGDRKELNDRTESWGYSNRSREEYNELLNKVKNAMKSLNLGGRTDKEIIKLASEWICEQIEYDYDIYEGRIEAELDVYEALIGGRTVCEGYARATTFVLGLLGYTVVFEAGLTNQGLHAWNSVLLEGQLYGLDNTWNDFRWKWFLTDVSGDHETEENLEVAPLATGTYMGNGRTALRAWLIDIEDENRTVSVGDKINLSVDQLSKNVTSTDPSIVKVNADGSLTALKAGRVNITRTDGEYQSTFYVLVKDITKDITKITTSKDTYAISVSDSVSLGAKSTSGEKITYSSSNKSIATVSSAGKVKGIAKGKATITIKSGSASKKVTINVVNPAISGLKNSYTVRKGKTLKLTYTIKSAGNLKVKATGGDQKIKLDGLYVWSDCAEIVKATDKYITIKGIEKGKTTITLKVGNIKKKIAITVK